MAIVVTFSPATPTGGSGVVITATPGAAADLEGPATIKVTRDSDSEVIAQSPPSGTGEVFGSTDEVETLTVAGTGGTYALTVDGHATAAIAWNANAAAIEAAVTLAAGSDILGVSGTGPFTLSAKGADLNILDLVTVDASLLTGGGASIASVTAGGAFKLDPAGVLVYGPIIMKTGAYHIDVVDASNASLLGATVALTVF